MSVKRDPHHRSILGVSIEKSVGFLDLRADKDGPEFIKDAHTDLVMSLDFNPNKLNTIVTCG